MGLLYPCFCTRKEIQSEIAAAGNAPHGPDGPLYPGTCRGRSIGEYEERIARARAEFAAVLETDPTLRRQPALMAALTATEAADDVDYLEKT